MDKLIHIRQAAQLLGVTPMTLRRYDASGVLRAIRKGSRGDRYYLPEDLDNFLLQKGDLGSMAKEWMAVPASQASEITPAHYCSTRDIFVARADKLQLELAKLYPDNPITSIVPAVVGEIGNNAFDHNIGNWPDIPGIFFAYNLNKKTVVIADRGQGILQTLRRVKPSLANDTEALEVAFTETLSGRAPEARGNGLKFVKKSVESYPLTLIFQTGSAELELSTRTSSLDIHPARVTLRGCYALIEYEI